MKVFRTAPRKARLGFSLVESSLSVTVLSFGVLSLAPMLGLGLNSARQARDHQLTAQIAETLSDQAREGSLTTGEGCFDDQGAPCTTANTRYRTTTTETALPGNCTRLVIQITLVNTPQRPVLYAVVLPSP